jgi:hypothetical protein
MAPLLGQAVWRVATGIMLAYLLVGSFWLQPWYLVWVLALAVLLPGDTFTLWVLPWYCFGALTSNFVLDTVGRLTAQPPSAAGMYGLSLIISLSPLLLAVLGHRALRSGNRIHYNYTYTTRR